VNSKRLQDREIADADGSLLQELDDGFARVARQAGEWLACRPGCSECCHGPFPITRLDEWRLRRALVKLEQEQPHRALAIVTRAQAAVTRLSDGFPGDPQTGRPDNALERLDPFLEKHGDLACPALDPESGHCELHDARPIACRTYGPPLKFGDRKAAPCRLCFSNAPEELLASCRFEPDPTGIEGEILRSIGARDDEPWETLIAFALARD
jgi:Fe-S-cluster containining protein